MKRTGEGVDSQRLSLRDLYKAIPRVFFSILIFLTSCSHKITGPKIQGKDFVSPVIQNLGDAIRKDVLHLRGLNGQLPDNVFPSENPEYPPGQ